MVLAEEDKAEFWRVFALGCNSRRIRWERLDLVPLIKLNRPIQTRLALAGHLSGSVYLLNDSLFVPPDSRRPT